MRCKDNNLLKHTLMLYWKILRAITETINATIVINNETIEFTLSNENILFIVLFAFLAIEINCIYNYISAAEITTSKFAPIASKCFLPHLILSDSELRSFSKFLVLLVSLTK